MIGAILNYVIMLSVINQQREALLSISGTRVREVSQAEKALLRFRSTRQLWSGQNAQSYNSNAIAYGALAQQMFAAGKTYYMVPAALGIGCLLPIPFWLMHKRFPNFGFNNVHTYIITQYSCYMVGSSSILTLEPKVNVRNFVCQSVGVNTSVNPAMVIGIVSQWFVRKRYPRLFTKYK